MIFAVKVWLQLVSTTEINLIIDGDNSRRYVKYSHPSLTTLLFPYMYANRFRHSSMVPNYTDKYTSRARIYTLPENHGFVRSSLDGETISSWDRSLLLLKDDKFVTNLSFLFLRPDTIKKNHCIYKHFHRIDERKTLAKKKKKNYILTIK
jgi:hypothetical protein